MAGISTRRLTAIAVLICSFLGCSAIGRTGPVSARPMIDPSIFVLHGSGAFRNAAATAIVARLAGDRVRLTIVAEHLPALTTMLLKGACRVYVAWLVDSSTVHDPTRWRTQGVVLKEESGIYFAQGPVTARAAASVIITVEPAAQALTHALPARIVLTSAPYGSGVAPVGRRG